MVTVTKSTIDYTLTKHIRDVLRNNITDPEGRYSLGDSAYWIFKSDTDDEVTQDNLPRIIVEAESISWSARTWGNKGRYDALEISITVYCLNPGTRDQLSDSIRVVLLAVLSADADGTSFQDNLLRCTDVQASTGDPPTSYPKMLRIKNITAIFKFRG